MELAFRHGYKETQCRRLKVVPIICNTAESGSSASAVHCYLFQVSQILVKQGRKAERWCLNFVDLCLYTGACCIQKPRRFKGPQCYGGDGVKTLTSELYLLPYNHFSGPVVTSQPREQQIQVAALTGATDYRLVARPVGPFSVHRE